MSENGVNKIKIDIFGLMVISYSAVHNESHGLMWGLISVERLKSTQYLCSFEKNRAERIATNIIIQKSHH